MIYAGERVTLTVSRDSYVRWLPAIYQRSDVNGRNFVKDLLWIVQHLFGGIEEILDVGHTFYDPYEAPEHFLPWLASWSAMILDEEWPVAKKRRLIKKAVELYRIRGTKKGLKLFIALFTGHEPNLIENIWPVRGWRVGVTSEIGIDTVVLPPVNLAHTFVVEMPMAYDDISPEAVIRIHEIIQMEKPANAQYYLRFAVETRAAELREFYTIGTRSGINIGHEVTQPITSEEDYKRAVAEEEARKAELSSKRTQEQAALPRAEEGFTPPRRARPPLPKAPRADNAPVEGKEVRSREEGFGASARQLGAVSTVEAEAMRQPDEAPMQPMPESDTDENELVEDHDPEPPAPKKKKK
jgi:phage tail-like protein